MSSPFEPPAEPERPAPAPLAPREDLLLTYAQAVAGPKVVAAGGLGITAMLAIASAVLQLEQGSFGRLQAGWMLVFTMLLGAAGVCAWSGIRGFLAGPARARWARSALAAELWFWRLHSVAVVLGGLLVAALVLVVLVAAAS